MSKYEAFREQWVGMMHGYGIWIDPRSLMVSAGIPPEHVKLAEHYNVIAAEISSVEKLTDDLLTEIMRVADRLIINVVRSKQHV